MSLVSTLNSRLSIIKDCHMKKGRGGERVKRKEVCSFHFLCHEELEPKEEEERRRGRGKRGGMERENKKGKTKRGKRGKLERGKGEEREEGWGGGG
jgi:hypothetical protein